MWQGVRWGRMLCMCSYAAAGYRVCVGGWGGGQQEIAQTGTGHGRGDARRIRHCAVHAVKRFSERGGRLRREDKDCKIGARLIFRRLKTEWLLACGRVGWVWGAHCGVAGGAKNHPKERGKARRNEQWRAVRFEKAWCSHSSGSEQGGARGGAGGRLGAAAPPNASTSGARVKTGRPRRLEAPPVGAGVSRCMVGLRRSNSDTERGLRWGARVRRALMIGGAERSAG